MIRVLKFQIVISVIACLLLWFYGPHYAMGSFLSGVLVVAGNFILLATSWKLIFSKKLIAVSVLIIVFKYAILGIIVYRLVKASWMLPIWFSAGVTSMMISALIYGLTLDYFKEE